MFYIIATWVTDAKSSFERKIIAFQFSNLTKFIDSVRAEVATDIQWHRFLRHVLWGRVRPSYNSIKAISSLRSVSTKKTPYTFKFKFYPLGLCRARVAVEKLIRLFINKQKYWLGPDIEPWTILEVLLFFHTSFIPPRFIFGFLHFQIEIFKNKKLAWVKGTPWLSIVYS